MSKDENRYEKELRDRAKAQQPKRRRRVNTLPRDAKGWIKFILAMILSFFFFTLVIGGVAILLIIITYFIAKAMGMTS